MKRILTALICLLLALSLGCTALPAAPAAPAETLIPLLTVAPDAETPVASPAPGESALQEGAPLATDAPDLESPAPEDGPAVVYGERYDTKEDVAAYLNAYGELPPNFIRKNDARDLGWDSSAGNLWDVAYGKSIGGDRFGNYEGLLPEASGRTYYECDIGYDGGYRGAKRIIFSNDGLIYYTGDHYKSFTLLYGEE